MIVQQNRLLPLLLLALCFCPPPCHTQVSIRAPKSQMDKNIVVANDGSGDYTRIQDAIDHAEFNAKIRVKAGIYRENLMLKGFVTLEGAGAGQTVLLADPSSPAVQAYNLGSGKVGNMSFQFERPSDEPVLLVRYASFSLFNCALRNGETGIDIAFHSSVNIRDCLIEKNRTVGIRISGKSQGLVNGCTIADNGSDGLLVERRSSPQIERNTIRDNGQTAVRLSDQCMSRVAGNFLIANRDGISIRSGSSPIVRNNTIVAHRNGTGIALMDGDAVAIINNNIVGNNSGLLVQARGRRNTFVSNNLWLNGTNYVNVNPSPTDLSVDPKFLNESARDFRIDSSSALFERGTDRLSIGADFNYSKSENKLRIDYLKNQATKELGRENWYLAYQAAQEILSLDNTNLEGQNLRLKAAQRLALANIDRARTEYENDNLRLAENYIRNALSYDPESEEAHELKGQIDAASRAQQVRFMLVLAGSIVLVVALGYYARKRIQFSEKKRQAKWWLDDAEEHVELARGAESDKHAPADFADSVRLLAQAKSTYLKKQYEVSEQLCNETVRLANRAKDAADHFKQTRKDALVEVSNAESLMRQIQDSELMVHFAEQVREFSFYLERAQTALINKQFVLAKEVSEDIQNTIRRLQAELENERQQEVHSLIRETEELIIDALSSNSSTDIIIAVIDFKSELEILKSGFENGQLSIEEAKPQITQIRDFINEALRLGSATGGALASSRKRNYYDILGIKEDATLEQIKAVYRKLSMIYHPDMNAADELGIAGDERFREIKEAYEALILSKTPEGSGDHSV